MNPLFSFIVFGTIMLILALTHFFSEMFGLWKLKGIANLLIPITAVGYIVYIFARFFIEFNKFMNSF